MPASSAGLSLLLLASALAQSLVPQHVSLSLTSTPSELIISWAVPSSCSASSCRELVAWSTSGALPSSSWAVTTGVLSSVVLSETQAAPLRYTSVQLSGLAPNVPVFYIPGGSASGAPVYNYTVARARVASDRLPTALPDDWAAGPPRSVFCVLSDLGLANAQAMPRMLADAGTYDALVLSGDLAYDLFSYQGASGDAFLQAMAPLSSSAPWMVGPGNHEYQFNNVASPFNHFLKRFSALGAGAGADSGSNTSLWYRCARVGGRKRARQEGACDPCPPPSHAPRSEGVGPPQ